MRKSVLAVAFLFFCGAKAFSQTPVISLSPSSFSFNAYQSGSLPVSQNLQITNAGGGTLNWQVSKKHNSAWFSATPASGTAPSSVTVSITTTGLVPNTYVDTLVIYSASANPTTVYAPVTYIVSSPPTPAVISLSPASFNFSADQNGSLPSSQNLQLTNTGTGSLNWTVYKAHGAAWLSATPASGSAPSNITVSITTTGLVPNTYRDTLIFTSAQAGNSPQRVPVTYTVSPPPQPAVISLSPASFNFSADQNGSLPVSQNLQVANTGGGALNWTVTKKHNAAWLSATPVSGTAPSNVTVSITTAALSPNTYADTLVFTAAGASNSPQQVPVVYVVSPSPQPAVISLSPASFSFTASQSGSLPVSQNLQITNAGTGALNWVLTKKHNASWLSATPASGTAPSPVTVSITTTGLSPSTYVDTLVVSSGEAGNSPQYVPVVYVVSPPPQPAVISLSPNSFNFSAIQSGSLPVSQILQITNAGSGALNWLIAKKHNAAWLSATPASGTAPSGVTVSITATSLVPNTYVDTLVVSSGEAGNSPQYVPVVYVVSAPPQPAIIAVAPNSFEFNAIQSGPSPFSQDLQITNAGGGSLNWLIAKAHNAAWLGVTPASGTAPSTLNVAITTTGLAPNTYADTLVITSGDASNSPVRVPVAYTVFPAPSIVVSPESLNFAANEGDPNPSPQLILVDASDGTIAWSSSKSQEWLSLAPVADTGSGQISASVNLAGLTKGDYFDTVVVTAPAASNSPRRVPVHLHLNGPVLTPASLQIFPSSLDFNARRNEVIPSQTIDVLNGGQLPLNWNATILHNASWLSLSPASGTNGGTVTVSVATDLNPLTYVDTIKIEAAGALNSPRFIPVRLNIATDVGDDPANRPRVFSLSQNYPNPFNPATKIDFALPSAGRATLEVFNVVGQKIRVLVDEELSAGPHSVLWDGRGSSGQPVGSGIYFYRLKSQNYSDIKRMVFLK